MSRAPGHPGTALVAGLRFEHFQLAQGAEDRQPAELEIDARDDAVVEQLDALLEIRRAVRKVLHEEREVDVARGHALERREFLRLGLAVDLRGSEAGADFHRLLVDGRIEDLRQAVDAITNDPMLRGSASTKIAEIRTILAPIFTNVNAILDGTQVKPKVLFADLLRLGQLDFHGLLDVLNDAQAAIAKETETANAAGKTGEVAALQKLSGEFADVAKLLGDLSQKFVDATSPLRNKIEQVEVWFDTVTQSFDERYARHMRTAALVISVIVVIVLNANFFTVYKSLSSNEVQRSLILQKGPELLEQSKRAQLQASPTPTPANVQAALQQSREEIETLSSTYQGFGFTPLSMQQLRSFFWSLGFLTAVAKDEVKKEHGVWGMALVEGPENVYKWQNQSIEQWWQARKSDVTTLVGWAIMVMLLSVGAPFWQDALE